MIYKTSETKLHQGDYPQWQERQIRESTVTNYIPVYKNTQQ